MKRKLSIIGDMRYMMREIFKLDDLKVDEVKTFMEGDFIDIPDVVKKAATSDMTDRQKMLVAFICGNTCGINDARDLNDIAKRGRDDNIIPMAG